MCTREDNENMKTRIFGRGREQVQYGVTMKEGQRGRVGER